MGSRADKLAPRAICPFRTTADSTASLADAFSHYLASKVKPRAPTVQQTGNNSLLRLRVFSTTCRQKSSVAAKLLTPCRHSQNFQVRETREDSLLQRGEVVLSQVTWCFCSGVKGHVTSGARTTR